MKSRFARMAAAAAMLTAFSMPGFAADADGNWKLQYVEAVRSTPLLTMVLNCVYKKTGGKATGENYMKTAIVQIEVPVYANGRDSCGETRANLGGNGNGKR